MSSRVEPLIRRGCTALLAAGRGWAAVLTLVAACSSDPLVVVSGPDAAPPAADAAVSTPDADPLPDAEPAPDAPELDAGSPDAAEPRPDAVAPDLGLWPDAAAADSGTSTRTIAQRCFAGVNTAAPASGPQYDPFNPTVGSHCFGTNHQQIDNIERVVFLGDSVTVGTPPTVSGEYYRNRLTDLLVARFGLQAPGVRWRTVNPFDGMSYVQDSGDFSTCARWGARTDDLNGPGNQLEQCFPSGELGKRTLVIMTMGGNDIASLTKEGAASHMPLRTPAELRQMTQQFVDYLRQAIVWLKTPGRFPAGVFVIFANPPEFTDGTGRVESCGLSSVAGFNDPWPNPRDLEDLVVYALEQYMAIAVDTQTDLLWFLESFCGHGFVATGPNADPMNRCYRGPNTERWFDLTCIHPNPRGHEELANMFMAIVNE